MPCLHADLRPAKLIWESRDDLSNAALTCRECKRTWELVPMDGGERGEFMGTTMLPARLPVTQHRSGGVADSPSTEAA